MWISKEKTLLKVRNIKVFIINARKKILTLPLRGFTIVELLIVTAIIGILVTGAIKLLPGLIQKTKQKEAVHAMLLIRQAELAYLTEYPGTYIPLSDAAWDIPLNNANFSYDVHQDTGIISATSTEKTGKNYQMNISTGKVSEF